MKYIAHMMSVFSFGLAYASALTSEELKAGLTPDTSGTVGTVAEGESLLDGVFAFARDGIFGLLFLLALCVFLYIAVRLIMAKGNPEEFKKALNSFIYAAIGLFIVAFAWAAVRLVAGLSI